MFNIVFVGHDILAYGYYRKLLIKVSAGKIQPTDIRTSLEGTKVKDLSENVSPYVKLKICDEETETIELIKTALTGLEVEITKIERLPS